MASSAFDIAAGSRGVRFTPEMLQLLFAQKQSQDARDAYLLSRIGRRWGDVHCLQADRTTPAGRITSDGILIQDERCSRKHCEFYRQGEQWYVRDLGSRNGTLLNGKLIQVAMPLRTGDLIRIGDTKLLFTLDLGHAISHADTDDEDDDATPSVD